MVLDGMGVPFQQVDITVRGNEMERDFMREKAINPRNGTDVPLPPQIFYKFEYLGVSFGNYFILKACLCSIYYKIKIIFNNLSFQNYHDFEEAVENNRLEEFLRLLPPEEEDVADDEVRIANKR